MSFHSGRRHFTNVNLENKAKLRLLWSQNEHDFTTYSFDC